MNHPNHDRILEFVLGVLDESEMSMTRTHLAKCDKCTDVEQKCRRQVEQLASIHMQVDLPHIPRVRAPRYVVDAWKYAAVLAAGFLLGLTTARIDGDAVTIPVPQRMVPTSASHLQFGAGSCPAVDLKTPPNR